MPTGSVRPRVQENGFSLTEALVASWLLASAVAAVVQLLVHASHASLAARETTYATVLATQKMEELRAASWPVEAAAAMDYADVRWTVRHDEGPEAIYQRRWTVEPLALVPDAVAITVTVTRRGVDPAVALVRLITLRGGSRVDADGDLGDGS